MFKEKFRIDFNPRRMGELILHNEYIGEEEVDFITTLFKRTVKSRGGFTNISDKKSMFSNYPNIIITNILSEFCENPKIFLSD